MADQHSQFNIPGWRITVPLFSFFIAIAMVALYLLAASTAVVFSDSTDNILQEGVRSLQRDIESLRQDQQRSAQTLAFVSGVPQAVRSGNPDNVQNTLITRAGNSGLDLVALTDLNRQLIIGLIRGQDSRSYERISVLDTSAIADDQAAGGMLNFGDEAFLVSAMPVTLNQIPVGQIYVGQRMQSVLDNLNPSSMTELVFFAQTGTAAGSTMSLASSQLNNPAPGLDTIGNLILAGQNYHALDSSFDYGDLPLGTLRLLIAGNSPQAASLMRHMGSLMLALLGGILIIALFVGLHWSRRQGNRLPETTDSPVYVGSGAVPIRAAQSAATPGPPPRQDALQHSLRRQRRENERLTAIIESLPDGVIVQDLDGQVLLLNEKARELLGSTRVLNTNTDLSELMARGNHRLGPALAPGLFALGDAQRIQIGQRTLSAQAAAVMTVTRQHLGTVIVVRDITEEVERETARKRAIQDLADEVHDPLVSLIPATRQYPAEDFSREIERHTSTLQRMILELRDLSDARPDKQADQQRPILLDSLVWAVANEWRQVAQAQNLTFHVMIERPGQYVLGQERRLRWAIGNIIDNAIKYTLPGGDLTIEIQDLDSDDYAHLRVRDNGVGIARPELPHVMTRFYRGRPVTADGQLIRVPGSGQGLFLAKQIFEAHGGSIDIKSKPEVGTAVYFTLPLTAELAYELPRFTQQFEGETLPLDPYKNNRDTDETLSQS